MRGENARLGVETTARSAKSPDRADRSVSGIRAALTGTGWKKPSNLVQGWEQSRGKPSQANAGPKNHGRSLVAGCTTQGPCIPLDHRMFCMVITAGRTLDEPRFMGLGIS